jgi:hypothetical protein
MSAPLLAMLEQGVVPTVVYPLDSRYHGLGALTWCAPDGREIAYLARRFVPQPGAANYAILTRHTVSQGERLDQIAAKYLGDPLMAWLICDANGAMRPAALVETPGRVLAITAPQGIPGVSSA